MTSITLDFASYTASVYKVTPNQAQYWLDNHNTANRSVRERHVRDLARQMDLGYWRTTHEGIAFDTDGVLVDGQHRLHAIVVHDRPIEMLVWTGMKPEVRLVVGDGARRTAADQLSLVGYNDVDRAVTSTLSLMLSGMHAPARGSRPSTRELEELYLKYRDAVLFAHTHLPKAKNVPLNSGVRAAVARAYYHVSLDVLETFCEVFMTAMPVGSRKPDAPLKLRQYTVRNSGKLGSSKARIQTYAITENMILKFANDQKVALTRPTTTEMFPLPEKAVDRTPKGAVVMRRRPGEATRYITDVDAAVASLTGERRA